MKTMKSFAKKILATLTATAIAISGAMTTVPTMEVSAEEIPYVASETLRMYRMYNPNSGEHFYTSKNFEMCKCMEAGWRFESIGWVAPRVSDIPVYRLYNPNTGDHHYTVNSAERDMCVNAGWNDEGIGWYSSTEEGALPLYREYNPNTGRHNYTTEWGEHAVLVTTQGWNDEGIAWYGNANSITEKNAFNQQYDVKDYPNFPLRCTFIHVGESTDGMCSYFFYYVPVTYDWDLLDSIDANEFGGITRNFTKCPKDSNLHSDGNSEWYQFGGYTDGDNGQMLRIFFAAPHKQGAYIGSTIYNITAYRTLYDGQYLYINDNALLGNSPNPW